MLIPGNLTYVMQLQILVNYLLFFKSEYFSRKFIWKLWHEGNIIE